MMLIMCSIGIHQPKPHERSQIRLLFVFIVFFHIYTCKPTKNHITYWVNPKYPLSNFVFRILKTDIKKVVCITHTTEKMLSISTYFKTNRFLSFNVGYHGRESYGKLNRQDTYMPNGQTLANYHFNLFCVACLSVYVTTNTLSNIDNSPGLNKARVSKA